MVNGVPLTFSFYLLYLQKYLHPSSFLALSHLSASALRRRADLRPVMDRRSPFVPDFETFGPCSRRGRPFAPLPGRFAGVLRTPATDAGAVEDPRRAGG